MARNFVQPGETVTLPAPYAVASGGGMKVGVIIAIALADAAQNAPVEARRVGVWDIAKASGESWVAWQTKIYWDDTNRRFTLTATNNTLAGVATQNQASADTTGRALLTGQLS